MYYLRILAIVLAALPQAFAPLVHAHVGVDLSPSEIHLPGLEMKAESGGRVMESYSAGFREGGVVNADQGVRKLQACFPSSAFLPLSWVEDATIPRPVAPVALSQAAFSGLVRLFPLSRAPPA